MRILNATEEMSSHPVKNPQWGARIRLEDTRATKKANLRTGMGLSRRYQEGRSQITAPLTININPNGKSRFISRLMKIGVLFVAGLLSIPQIATALDQVNATVTGANVQQYTFSNLATETLTTGNQIYGTAKADGQLNMDVGRVAVQAHSCDSSSTTVLGSDAAASSSASFADTVYVNSATLPAGTLVQFNLNLEASVSGRAVCEPTAGIDDYGSATAAVSFSYGQSMVSGSYNNQQNAFSTGPDTSTSGLFVDPVNVTFDVAVGSYFSYDLSLEASTEAGINGVGSPFVDGDVSATLLYGFAAVNPDGSTNTSVSLVTGTGTALPSLTSVTPQNAISYNIPDPFTIPYGASVPEPSQYAYCLISAAAGFLACRRFSRRTA